MYYREMSSSMVPFLRQGDLVKVTPFANSRLGDIVLWQKGESLVMHRVVAKFYNRIITKGDARGYWDEPVNHGDILGKAISRERCGRERSLDSLGARFLGLAFCLTSACVPRLLTILATVKRLGRDRLGCLSNRANF
jgi:hypothetical protein